jgi:hypothetical protein
VGLDFLFAARIHMGAVKILMAAMLLVKISLEFPARSSKRSFWTSSKKNYFPTRRLTFYQETTAILKGRKSQQDPERALHQLSIGQAEREIANIMKAIKAGIVTPTTKLELERAETDLNEAKTALEEAAGISELLTTVLPDAGGCYRALVKKLGETLYTDVPHARQCLKAALGLVRLVPSAAGGLFRGRATAQPRRVDAVSAEKECWT